MVVGLRFFRFLEEASLNIALFFGSLYIIFFTGMVWAPVSFIVSLLYDDCQLRRVALLPY